MRSLESYLVVVHLNLDQGYQTCQTSTGDGEVRNVPDHTQTLIRASLHSADAPILGGFAAFE